MRDLQDGIGEAGGLNWSQAAIFPDSGGGLGYTGRFLPKNAIRRARPYALWFVLLSLVYHANLRPVASGDSLPAALIPFSVVLDGTLTLDRFGPWMHRHIPYSSEVVEERGGHWYSVYPIAGPVLVSPLYLPLRAAPVLRGLEPDVLTAIARVLEKFVAVALAAITAVLLVLLLERVTTRRWAWTIAIAFALGTGNWSTASQALWQHTFGQLAIVASLYCLERGGGWIWGCGVCAGCAMMIRPTNLALAPALAVGLWMQRGTAMRFLRLLAGPAVGVALVAAYNLRAFGQISGGYPARLTGSFFGGLAGVLASPGRGLLIYTPLVIFAVCGLLPEAREARRRHAPLVTAALVFGAIHLAIVAKWETWWGGYCWGPRLMTEMVAPLMILIAVGVAAMERHRWKKLFLAVTVYCCLIQAIGVFCYPKGRWDHLPVSVNAEPGRLWDWSDNPIGRTVRGGLAWEPYAVVWAAVTEGLPAAGVELEKSGVNPY